MIPQGLRIAILCLILAVSFAAGSINSNHPVAAFGLSFLALVIGLLLLQTKPLPKRESDSNTISYLEL